MGEADGERERKARAERRGEEMRGGRASEGLLEA
jgi:hypothetical protein